MVTEDPFEARVAAIVRIHLEKRFGDWVFFEAIMAVPKTDHSGATRTCISYDGDGEPLDARWPGGLHNQMRRELRPLGVSGVVPASYIDRSELDPSGRWHHTKRS